MSEAVFEASQFFDGTADVTRVLNTAEIASMPDQAGIAELAMPAAGSAEVAAKIARKKRDEGVAITVSGVGVNDAIEQFEGAMILGSGTERTETAIVASDILLRRELNLRDGGVTAEQVSRFAKQGEATLPAVRDAQEPWRYDAATLSERRANAEALLIGGSSITAGYLALKGMWHSAQAYRKEGYLQGEVRGNSASELFAANARAGMLALTNSVLVRSLPGIKGPRQRAIDNIATYKR